MLKTLFTLFIAAIALPSMIILITIRNMNNLLLLTSLFFNILCLTSIIYIQSIGSDIKIYTFILYFILFNNIFLSITKLIYNILSVKSKIKELLRKIITYYTKFFFVYPNYILRILLITCNRILNVLNNRINNSLYD